jgi:hypothetical protein
LKRLCDRGDVSYRVEEILEESSRLGRVLRRFVLSLLEVVASGPGLLVDISATVTSLLISIRLDELNEY